MKTKTTKLLSCMLGFVAVLCFALAFTFNTPQPSVDATELISSTIKDEYYVGEELVMPTTVDILVGENQTITGSNGVLVFPDGTLHNSASYYFELEGKYQAIYYGTHEGKTIKAVKSFKVLKPNWSISSSKSDISYMEELPSNKQSGIRVSLAEGDAFVFDQRVNLYDIIKTQGDLFSVISYTPEYWREGEEQLACQTISVKLVDYYNPDNFVEFYQWGPSGAIPYKLDGELNTSTLYAGMAASHQTLNGLEYYSGMTADRITDKFDGYQGRLHKSTRYAQVQAYGAVYSSVSNHVYAPNNAHSKTNPDRYNAAYFEDLNKTALKQVNFKFNMNTGHGFGDTTFLSSVKSEYVHGKNLWEGFTTGEVYVQVQCFNYRYGTPVNIDITSILGISGADLNKAYVKDTVRPVVEFDSEYTDKNGVYIQKDKAFTIPMPTVYDVNYEGDLDVAVYYNYNSDSPISVYLKDNVFTPKNYGRYTAVYTAKDKFGNSTVVTYDMNVITGAQFDFDDQNKLSELSAATENVLPVIEPVGMNNAVSTKVYVVDPAGNAKDVTATMSYAPEYIGNYKIRYVFTDNATTETFEYTVESKEKGYVLFRDGFKVSSYLIKDAVYDFDNYYAYKATANGLAPVKATVQASVDNKEFANIANLDQYKIQGESSVVFKAVYEENFHIIADCKVVDVAFNETEKNYWKYFQGDYEVSYKQVLDKNNQPVEGKTEYSGLDKSYIGYSFLAGTLNKKLDFINPLMLSSFALDVSVPEGSTYTEYKIVLSEFGNPANKMIIRYSTIIRGIDTLLVVEYMDANGERLHAEEIGSKFIGKHSIFIKDGVFNTTEGVSYSAPNFDDYRIMVSIEIVSDEDCSIQFNKISNQGLHKNIARNSEAKPQLHYVRVAGDYTLGSTVEVPKAYAVSVFSPVLEKDITVSVTNNEGTEYISNANGQLKDLIANQDYYFDLAYLGIFKVTYKYSATAGKNVTRSDETTFVVNCSDSIEPEITFEDGISEKILITLKEGKTHKIKGFTVSDNETPAEELLTYVIIYNEFYTAFAFDLMNPETFNGEYTFETPGNYIVQVYCQDAAGNYSTRYYSICVLED